MLFQWAGVWSIMPVVTLVWCSLMSLHGHCGCSWTSLCLLESPSFSKMPVNLIQYRGTVGSFNNRHSARELKYRNLSLRSHNNIFAHCFFYHNSGFLFVLFLTVFLVIKHNTCNGTINSKALSFFVIVTKIWIAIWLYIVLLLLGGDIELIQDPNRVLLTLFQFVIGI